MLLTGLLIAVCFAITSGHEENGFCSQIRQMNMFCTNQLVGTHQSRTYNKILRGKAGPPGPPGVVDYEGINASIAHFQGLIQTNVASIESELRKEISRSNHEVGRKLSTMNSKVESNTRKVELQGPALNDFKRELSTLNSRFETELSQATADLSNQLNSMTSNLQYKDQRITQLESELVGLRADVKLQVGFVMAHVFKWYKARNNFYYKVFNEAVDYNTAKANCNEYGANLASAGIREPSIYREILPLIKSSGNDYVWIGLNNLVFENIFLWSDGVPEERDSTPWAYSQPDNWNNEENCAEVSAERGTLNDVPCSNHVNYICERKN